MYSIIKCGTCAQNKPPVKKPRGLLGSVLSGAPWERLATDVIGPLPVTKEGNRYILVFMDYFTKWVEAFAVPDQTATTTTKVLLNQIVSRFGCPYLLHSDQGRNYESTVFAELCKLLHFRKTRTTPRNPKSNGMVERFNRTLIRLIRCYLINEDDEWDVHLKCLTAAYRSTPQESTGLTPNMLLFGREVRMPTEVVYQPLTSTGEAVSTYGETIGNRGNRGN